MRRTIAACPEIIPGRPDLDWYRSDRSTPQFGVTRAKKHPKYVHGKMGMAALLHKISYVNLHWYTTDSTGHNLVRLIQPRMIAHTVCGNSWHIATSSNTCDLPKPETILCGRCHGQGVIWKRGEKAAITMREARLRLGCIARGE